MENVEQFLQNIGARLQALEAARNLYSEQLAPDFTTFNYVDTSELGLSRIIADLLNTKGSHAQKNLFLKLFMERCLTALAENQAWQPFMANLDKAQIRTEETTWAIQSRRRMDIYISCQTEGNFYCICIENKPYGWDQKDQLSDYARELEARSHGECSHLVYLCEAGKPSEFSVKADDLKEWQENNRFSHVRFSDLIGWLKACKAECQNSSVSEFINQFIKFIQSRFMGVSDMSVSNEIGELVFKNMSSAVSVQNNLEAAKERYFMLLKLQIEQECQARGWKLYDFDFHDSAWSGMTIGFTSEKADFSYGVEFQKAGRRLPLIGAWRNHRNASEETFQIVKEACLNKFASKRVKSSQNWMCYMNLTSYDDWNTSTEIWEKIQSGEICNEIIVFGEELKDLLSQNNLFEAFNTKSTI